MMVGKVVERSKASIVCLQEVCWLTEEMSIFAQKQGFRYHEAITTKDPNKCILVLSKYKPLFSTIVPLFHNGSIVIGFETNGEFIQVAFVHLSPHDEAIRLTETKKVLSTLSTKRDFRNFIMGDMNSVSIYDKDTLTAENSGVVKPKFTVTNYLHQHAYTDIGANFATEFIPTVLETREGQQVFHNLRLDYCFCANDVMNHVLKYDVIINDKTKALSDHYPILVRINL